MKEKIKKCRRKKRVFWGCRPKIGYAIASPARRNQPDVVCPYRLDFTYTCDSQYVPLL